MMVDLYKNLRKIFYDKTDNWNFSEIIELVGKVLRSFCILILTQKFVLIYSI